MTGHDFDPRTSLKVARAHYFAINHFGPDGGYSEPFVQIKVGPIPFALPNGKGRVQAVRYHDLHHVVTGYATDFVGELEISAWEVGAGCGKFWFAWAINLAGMAGGTLAAPRRTFRAFVRGRASRSLYGEDFEALLEESVGAVQQRLGLPEATRVRATAGDLLTFVSLACVGVGAAVSALVVAIPLTPIALFTTAQRALQPNGK